MSSSRVGVEVGRQRDVAEHDFARGERAELALQHAELARVGGVGLIAQVLLQEGEARVELLGRDGARGEQQHAAARQAAARGEALAQQLLEGGRAREAHFEHALPARRLAREPRGAALLRELDDLEQIAQLRLREAERGAAERTPTGGGAAPACGAGACAPPGAGGGASSPRTWRAASIAL